MSIIKYEPENDNKQNNKNGGEKRKTRVSFFKGLVLGAVIISLLNTGLTYVIPILRQNFGTEQGTGEIPLSLKINAIFQALDERYVGEYDEAEMQEHMLRGMVEGVGDPYTTYMSPEAFERFAKETEGVYAGIGVSVSVDESDNSILVITVFDDCPGALAGMLPGDKIIAVNGDDVYGNKLNEAVSLMTGEPGTDVQVTVYRESDDEIIDFELERAVINNPTVSHKMLENNIGYIRITNFDRVTLDQFKEAYSDIKGEMSGLILDLRNNPGGLLNVVTDITDILVPEGTIVYTEDKQGERVYSKSDAEHIEVPLIVLVNGYSASASEVLSGAVQDLGVGELLGTQTFGKGLVQDIVGFTDGSALKLTIAKYYTPSGVCIQGEGLTPDYVVEMEDELTARISTLEQEEDIQLMEAIRIMNEKIE